MASRSFFIVAVCTFVSWHAFFTAAQTQPQTQTDFLGRAGFPLNLTGFPLDPCKMYGTWYEYKYITPGIVDANAFNTYLPIGIASTNPLTVAMQWTSQSFVYNAAGTPQCTPIFQQSNFTATGQKNSAIWRPGSQTPVPGTFTILFTDYETVEIATRCQVPSTTRTGFCQVPFIFVNTRTRAPFLPEASKTFIQTTVDQTLLPFGYRFSDLNTTVWDNSLSFPPCNPAPTPPALFVTQVTNLRTTLLNNGGCYSFSGLPR